MTGLGVQQTNRRMCRYLFLMLNFLCWPQDVYEQGIPSVSCEAGEVTVGERATITCIFPAGSITPGNSNFVVNKFTDSNPRDGTDIMYCFHETGSTSEIPKCIFPNTSLGYNFTFVPRDDRQTVVIPSAKQSHAGEYGCDRVNHMVTTCNLAVQLQDMAPKKPDMAPEKLAIDQTSPLLPGRIVSSLVGAVCLLGVLVAGGCIIIRRTRNGRRNTSQKNPIYNPISTKPAVTV